MKTELTRDIVSDLWPLYEAGEASADTKKLVEEFLRSDPEFEKTLRRARDIGPAVQPPALPGAAVERETVNRTRAVVRRRSWTLAFALLCAMLPFSFAFVGDGVRFLMLRDVPGTRWLWVVAVVLAIYHYRLGRSLKLGSTDGLSR
jgi:hypothetical protein